MKTTISMQLMQTLQAGKERMNTTALERVVRFVNSQRTADDLFVNKSGEADLYYTSFGWLLSYVLGIRLDVDKMNAYLEEVETETLDLVHYAAYMRCQMLCDLMRKGMIRFTLSMLRAIPVRDLSTFKVVPHQDSKAPYTQFVWLSLLEDTQNEIENRQQVLNDLSAYQVGKGGYTNLKGHEVASTNATAAALMIKGQLETYKPSPAVYQLGQMQEVIGGFKAVKESPIPDLLSTATALFALRSYGVEPRYQAADFVEAHWLESGGFAATLMEDESDVEYVFYGLLALGSV